MNDETVGLDFNKTLQGLEAGLYAYSVSKLSTATLKTKYTYKYVQYYQKEKVMFFFLKMIKPKDNFIAPHANANINYFISII